MKKRNYTLDDQKTFAALSGDYNPVHLDMVVARRLIFGRLLVHGIHSLLWALDNWLEGHPEPLELSSIKVSFLMPIGVGEEVEYILKCKDKYYIEIILLVGSSKATYIQLDWIPSKRQRAEVIPTEYPQHHKCKKLSVGKMATVSGKIHLYLNIELTTRLFPNIVRVLPLEQIAVIVATTRLVGMECPGLNSIFY